MPLPAVEKMPLNQINISLEQRDWLALFFADIRKRGALAGNLDNMMLEAYILGFHHCLNVTSSQPPEKQ